MRDHAFGQYGHQGLALTRFIGRLTGRLIIGRLIGRLIIGGVIAGTLDACIS